ncbi:MAG: hypothetical protein AB9888_15250 [Bacteroidales bacterium]
MPYPVLKFSGKGNQEIPIKRWNGPALLSVQYDGTEKFELTGHGEDWGGEYDLLVKETGKYKGNLLIDAARRVQIEKLAVKTVGAWNLEIKPINNIRIAVDSYAVEGTGSDVILIAPEKGKPLDKYTVRFSNAGKFYWGVINTMTGLRTRRKLPFFRSSR